MMPQTERSAGWLRAVGDLVVIVLLCGRRQDGNRGAVLRAVGIDGADAADRRRVAGDKISLRLQLRFAAGEPGAAQHHSRSSARCRNAATWWCSAGPATVRRSGSSASSACPAIACRCVAAGCGSTARPSVCRRTASVMENPTTAPLLRLRVSQTLPGGRNQTIFQSQEIRPARQCAPVYPEVSWMAPHYEGGRFYRGYWDGRRGRREHDHRWDRKHNRDFKHR